MNGFLNFRLRLGQAPSNLVRRFHLILLVLSTTIFQRIVAQTPPLLLCQEETPVFTGFPEQTLCEKNPNFNCEIQIGTGTPFPKSSLLGSPTLSGNVCVVGNFEVDAPLTFVDATVKITPSVTITITPSLNGYDGGSSLGINNSKLFACDGLWKGITLGQLSSIASWNNSVIEDAETAIFASGFCILNIHQTTLNRARVGIELYPPFPNISAPGPVMWVFTGNQFSCTAPLNGTPDEITQIGVKLRDADLYPFFANNDNTFRGIINGIVAESSGSNAFAFCNVFANNYLFDDIRDKGIDFRGRSLDVRNSTFEHIAKHGIYFHESSLLNLTGNEFYIREINTPMILRFMVDIEDPRADNNLHILDNYFFTDSTALFNFTVFAIRLNVIWNSKFVASIHENTFDLYNTSYPSPGDVSHGISVWGSLTSDSDIEIKANHINGNPLLNANRGILAVNGNKHHLHVIDNHF